MNRIINETGSTTGEFTNLTNERFYVIRNVDRIAPFFISVLSDNDHWLFISSTGGLTAGRVSPETALFPYITVDRIHESTSHTGSKTVLRVNNQTWEPFNQAHDGRYDISRHLYKSILGNKLYFEEINHELELTFRYGWETSDSFGFIRRCQLQNLSGQSVSAGMIDGLQNILPAGTPLATQTNSSNLVDAYKWNELDKQTGLASFTLYSGISDRAEPFESLKANTVFCLGLNSRKVLLSSKQLKDFRQGLPLKQETHTRGQRGAYLINARLELPAGSSQQWQFAANIEQSQNQVVELRRQLGKPVEVAKAINKSVSSGTDGLARIVAACDGFQLTAEETVTAHHYSNTVFNLMRGGIFNDQYQVSQADFSTTIEMFNHALHERQESLLRDLPDHLSFSRLQTLIGNQGDPQLERLGLEYLPITFGRRHGDPSRPWNQFAIKIKDKNGDRLLSYQGNWRDIFQNWEVLTFSYPEFIESVIAKFVNASTMDGYNPYRITKEGVDWEVEEPDNPWSYIGYWGDHQIIYLQKMLELSKQFHPGKLAKLLHQPIFSYANVPYRIKPLAALLEDAKRTVDYDEALAELIDQRVATIGADGKLVLDGNGEVYQVNLLEKLLVPLLAKLGNLVIDGGIWLNTQRPEWNDANNALVGQGLSMVTLCYMRRYIHFLLELLLNETGSTRVTSEVGKWLSDTSKVLAKARQWLQKKPLSAAQRNQSLLEIGEAASRYRQEIYRQKLFTDSASVPIEHIRSMLDDALAAIDHTIGTNQRKDGLYHAYNLLDLQQDAVEIDTLYPMLEGQVAALSAGAIDPEETVSLMETLFASDLYRPDQKSFMLYPDRQLPGFLAKNRVSAEQVRAVPLLEKMLELGDESILSLDADGCYRFSHKLTNAGDLRSELETLAGKYGDDLKVAREPLLSLYEQVFNHHSFTGRSGGMFGFEGLGCIYWHMVAKLLLAVQENFFKAQSQGADNEVCQRLGDMYYRVRDGLGFNKSPEEFGAFPTDPYSHTPKHAGAQQPGMTGQVKEELLARFGELGVRVENGTVSFQPALLRKCEFNSQAGDFRYLDVDGDWQVLTIPEGGLAFTWCQTPVVMRLANDTDPTLAISFDNGNNQVLPGASLPPEESTELFTRSGRIRRLDLVFNENQLFASYPD